jgi:hypothetical protein
MGFMRNIFLKVDVEEFGVWERREAGLKFKRLEVDKFNEYRVWERVRAIQSAAIRRAQMQFVPGIDRDKRPYRGPPVYRKSSYNLPAPRRGSLLKTVFRRCFS